MNVDQRLVKLIEEVLGLIRGERISTAEAYRLAQEIQGDGYSRGGDECKKSSNT